MVKPKSRMAVYTGSFDPITLGHVNVIERSARLVDKLIVGIGSNTEKQPLFSPEERVAMVCQATSHLSNIEVTIFQGLAVEFVRLVRAECRGIDGQVHALRPQPVRPRQGSRADKQVSRHRHHLTPLGRGQETPGSPFVERAHRRSAPHLVVGLARGFTGVGPDRRLPEILAKDQRQLVLRLALSPVDDGAWVVAGSMDGNTVNGRFESDPPLLSTLGEHQIARALVEQADEGAFIEYKRWIYSHHPLGPVDCWLLHEGDADEAGVGAIRVAGASGSLSFSAVMDRDGVRTGTTLRGEVEVGLERVARSGSF